LIRLNPTSVAVICEMSAGEFTENKLLVPRLLSHDQLGAIQELTKRLQATGRVQDAAAFYQAVLQREYMLRTALTGGVVFPHARGTGIASLSLAVGLSGVGIPWGPTKGSVARVVFLLAIPMHETQRYLALLASLSRLSQDDDLLSSLRDCTQPEQMRQVLNLAPAGPTPDR